MEYGTSLSLAGSDQPKNAGANAGPGNTTAPTISGTAEVGQLLTVSTGVWTGNGVISYNYQWLRDGAAISNAGTNTYLLGSSDDQSGISCRVTASDIDGSTGVNAPGVGVTYPAPVFYTQPAITPTAAQVGTVFTLSQGIAGPNTTITIDYFTLNGLDKTAELTGLNWDSAGETAGALSFRTSATNSGGSVQSVEVLATLDTVLREPYPFQTNDWSLTNSATSGALSLTISMLPAGGGSLITGIEYQINGGSWVATGLSDIGAFELTGLTDYQTYTVALRCVNDIGPAIASATKSAAPGTPAAETARFGTWNGTGNPASYDTGGTASDGNYGEFTISGGIISPNVVNLSAGTFQVGGYPVEVSDSTKAVASQAEFDNAVVNVGGLSGKTMVVRVGAEIVNTSAWYHKAIRRTDTDCVIVGDGNPEWEKNTFHFGHVTFDNPSRVTWRNLSFRSFTIKSDHSYGPVKQAIFEDNHFGNADPDANDDYSSLAYSGADCFRVQNSGVHGLRVVNNTFRGGGAYAHILFWYEEWGELAGNHFDKYYADAIKLRGADPVIVAANIATRPFSLSSDAGNPHSDSIQIEQTTGQSTDVYEANFFVRGNCRGSVSANLYIAGGPGFDGSAEGNGAISNGFFGNRATPTVGLKFDYNGALPQPGFSGTVGNYARNSIDFDLGGGTTLRNSFGGTVTTPASVLTSGNVELQNWDNATIAAALPGWALMTMDRPSYADALAAFTPSSGGALDGKGPGAVVTLAPGARAIDFQMASLRPTPNLSALSVTPSTSSFSASVTSDIAKRPIFWAVVPTGTTVTDWREVKERRVSGGLDYGFASSTSTGVVTIAGNAGTLASSTGYQLVIFQENGWTNRSQIAATSFTTL